MRLDREVVRRASPLEVVIPALTEQSIIGDGVERKTLCPWHEDRSPSLRVHTEKQQWHCDPCGFGGDVFAFVERHQQCDFRGALAFLAARAGLHRNGSDVVDSERANGHHGQIVATYDYRPDAATVRYQSVRFKPKDFRQRRPDGRGGWIWNLTGTQPLIYRRPDLHGQALVFAPEGEQDADRLWGIGLAATCNHGGAGKWKTTHSEQVRAAGVRSVVVLPDHDPAGQRHAEQVAKSCQAAGLEVRILALPDLPERGDVSDWLDAGHTADELRQLAEAAPVYGPGGRLVTPKTLADLDAVFTRWLGQEYDLDAMHVVVATAAASRLTGDPLWLLVVAGSGFTKTETVQSLAGAGAVITSTITSEGALLSATPKREKTGEATGGLLRQLGAEGLLVVKDVTSILSMNRDTRAGVLAALREVHDGRWTRSVGTDGGQSLTWQGRIVVVGASTTAWDRAHDVIATMGDRFVVVRMDSSRVASRFAAGRQAIENTGAEAAMRSDLAEAVAGVVAAVNPATSVTLTGAERDRILAAANVVTLARTGVEYDYRGDVIDAHAPEAPTRFAKQLSQVLRGAVAIGIGRPAALRLAIRCARDSMPPLRLAILDDVAKFPHTPTRDVRKRLAKPRATVDRQLQALHMLGVLACDEEDREHRGQPVTVWRYSLASDIDPDVLDPDSVPDLSVHVHRTQRRENTKRPVSHTDISGTESSVERRTDGLRF